MLEFAATLASYFCKESTTYGAQQIELFLAPTSYSLDCYAGNEGIICEQLRYNIRHYPSKRLVSVHCRIEVSTSQSDAEDERNSQNNGMSVMFDTSDNGEPSITFITTMQAASASALIEHLTDERFEVIFKPDISSTYLSFSGEDLQLTFPSAHNQPSRIELAAATFITRRVSSPTLLQSLRQSKGLSSEAIEAFESAERPLTSAERELLLLDRMLGRMTQVKTALNVALVLLVLLLLKDWAT